MLPGAIPVRSERQPDKHGAAGGGSSPGDFSHAHDGRGDTFGGYSDVASSSPPQDNYGFAAVGIEADSAGVSGPPSSRSILQHEEQTDGFGDEVRIRLSASSLIRLPLEDAIPPNQR